MPEVQDGMGWSEVSERSTNSGVGERNSAVHGVSKSWLSEMEHTAYHVPNRCHDYRQDGAGGVLQGGLL